MGRLLTCVRPPQCHPCISPGRQVHIPPPEPTLPAASGCPMSKHDGDSLREKARSKAREGFYKMCRAIPQPARTQLAARAVLPDLLTPLKNNMTFESLRDNIIGIDSTFDTPFGKRHLIYADYTASGRCLTIVEHYLQIICQASSSTPPPLPLGHPPCLTPLSPPLDVGLGGVHLGRYPGATKVNPSGRCRQSDPGDPFLSVETPILSTRTAPGQTCH